MVEIGADMGQEEVLALLARPETYGPGVASVERIDTHISAVFLAGDRAYKCKRAVTLPFLDFTRLADRRRFCERELAVNRIAAPDLYLGLAPVLRRRDGTLALGAVGSLGDGGEPIEWLVTMRRFDQAAVFDRLARQGALTHDHMRLLGAAVARFHAKAEPAPTRGGAAAMKAVVLGNRAAFRPFVPEVLAAAEVEAAVGGLLAAVERCAGLLDARRDRGMVRRCHGDLHLRNICQFEGRPTLFDAIEFNDDFAVIDIAYDLAFLLMDFEGLGLRPLGNAAFNCYQDYMADTEALAALPAFLSLRAMIRAHVSAAMAAAQSDPIRAAGLRDEARRDLGLALAFLAPSAPLLVAVGGLSGSGKSRLARGLAPSLGPAPGALVVRSDVVRKRLMGVDPYCRLDPAAYTAEASRRTYEAVYAEAAAALAAGHAVIVDAVMARPDERAAVEGLAQAAGVPFHGFWLDAPAQVLAKRVGKRTGDVSDATDAVVAAQLGYDLGDLAWPRLSTQGAKEETLALALALVRSGP